MNDYTSAAKQSDAYLRNGGPDFGERMNRILSNPVLEHRANEGRASAAPMLTDAERAALKAKDLEAARLAHIEGRILFPRTNDNVNPHD